MTIQGKSTHSILWLESLAEVNAGQWDALAAPLATPFLEWDWLRLMETSGSTTAATGWLPHHLTVWSGRDLVAAAPLYIKSHSLGEFVFDHAWANLAHRLGTAYYPKLVGMSPFTPLSGYRFLIAPGEDEQKITQIMLAEIDRLCQSYGLSGCSFLFVDPHWQAQLTTQGFSSWLHQSFIWKNRGFRSFEDYLAVFNANQRRNIRRERRALDKQGIELKMFSGDRIASEQLAWMYRFYERTNAKFGPWGCKFLTAAFFEGLFARLRHRLLLVAAFENHQRARPLGMSLLITKGNHLYGRYWGNSKKIDSLHFNVCYYQPIEWAISHGIHHFDPGAGGGHKIRRGFGAVANYSLHRFADLRLRRIMQANMDAINRRQQQQINALNQQLPFAVRSDSPDGVPRR